MESRMDKYNTNIDDIPKRSVKNRELYKQVYNAYDEFDNLIVPSNVKEIDLSTLKREISSRDEYRKIKDYGDITNNKVIRKEIVQEEQKKENAIYDINVLIENAVMENGNDQNDLSLDDNENYLKKLKLDDVDTMEVKEDVIDDELLKTANLSLEILSDLKGDNENTIVEAPVQEELIEEDDVEFYSGKYKFSDKDFEDNKNQINDEVEVVTSNDKPSKGKILIGILVIVILIIITMFLAILIV